jgi:hypothetical protein
MKKKKKVKNKFFRIAEPYPICQDSMSYAPLYPLLFSVISIVNLGIDKFIFGGGEGYLLKKTQIFR